MPVPRWRTLDYRPALVQLSESLYEELPPDSLFIGYECLRNWQFLTDHRYYRPLEISDTWPTIAEQLQAARHRVPLAVWGEIDPREK